MQIKNTYNMYVQYSTVQYSIVQYSVLTVYSTGVHVYIKIYKNNLQKLNGK